MKNKTIKAIKNIVLIFLLVSYVESNLNVFDWQIRNIIIFLAFSIYSFFEKNMLTISINYDNKTDK